LWGAVGIEGDRGGGVPETGVAWWSRGRARRARGGPDDVASSDAAGARPSLNLYGSHRHALDDKRRVAIPKAFREAVTAAGETEGWVLCRQLGGDSCLALFPSARFKTALERFEQMKNASLGVGPKHVREYMRKLSMSAAAVTPDPQGRITLTERQCELAGITKDVVFVGTGDVVEVWAAERLDGGDAGAGEDFGDLARRLFG
jgi:MraZ protein